MEKDLLIQEKEKLYIELKNILARQPGPEVAEQLNIYQASLREKTKQLKALTSELNMKKATVNEYQYEIERLTRELQDLKKKYYAIKRAEQSRCVVCLQCRLVLCAVISFILVTYPPPLFSELCLLSPSQ